MTMTTVTPSFSKAILGLLPGLGVQLPQSIIQRVNQINAEERLPMVEQDRFWQAIEQQSKDPHIGLTIGRALQPANYDMVGFLLLSSPNLATAVEGLVTYSALIGEGGTFRYSSSGSMRKLSYQAQFNVARRTRIEAILSSVVVGARWLVGDEFAPQEVGFEHAQVGELQTYQDIFGCDKVMFNQSSNYVKLSEQYWRQPLTSGSQAVQQHMHRLAQEQLKRLQPQTIKDQIIALLQQQPRLSRTQVAAVLAISERHLNRKLADYQTSFRAIAEQVRKKRAIELLAEQRHTQADIAALLGYSDDSAFAKAFKRWMGVGVREYRQQLSNPEFKA